MTESVVIDNNYQPTGRANEFHGSDAFVHVLVGGLGSGKSYAAIKELEQCGLEYSGMPMAVYRKTMPALRDSTLHEFKSHIASEVGIYKEKLEKFLFYNGSFINFRGLDDPTKSKSTEYALIVMEEAEEFSKEDFDTLKQRVRKKGPWPLRIVLCLNPVDEDHWIYKEFVSKAKAYDYFTDERTGEKGGGLNVLHFSTYDNIENLPSGYIEQISQGKTKDEIDRYIHGMWGSIIKGEPVYGKILNPTIHMRKVPWNPGMQLRRGWDFGHNHPACSFRVVDEFGRQNIKFEMMGDKEDLDIFALRVIQETENRFPNGAIFDYGDPRGHDKAPNGQDTCFEVLAGLGINAIGERGVRDYVEPGIKKVRAEISNLINGIPELTIDPCCQILRAAYFGKYVRGNDGKPKKDGYYDHLCDADRYISHHAHHTSAITDAMEKVKLRQLLLRDKRRRYTGY